MIAIAIVFIAIAMIEEELVWVEMASVAAFGSMVLALGAAV